MNIISPDAPTQGTQILPTLLNNIPAPKFHLFQNVRISKDRWGIRHRSGVITGIEFISPEVALLQHTKGSGWSYVVSFVQDIPPEEVSEFLGDPTKEYWEHRLEVVEG